MRKTIHKLRRKRRVPLKMETQGHFSSALWLLPIVTSYNTQIESTVCSVGFWNKVPILLSHFLHWYRSELIAMWCKMLNLDSPSSWWWWPTNTRQTLSWKLCPHPPSQRQIWGRQTWWPPSPRGERGGRAPCSWPSWCCRGPGGRWSAWQAWRSGWSSVSSRFEPSSAAWSTGLFD